MRLYEATQPGCARQAGSPCSSKSYGCIAVLEAATQCGQQLQPARQQHVMQGRHHSLDYLQGTPQAHGAVLSLAPHLNKLNGGFPQGDNQLPAAPAHTPAGTHGSLGVKQASHMFDA